VERLAAANGLAVRQKQEWGEILTGFEQRNKYLVSDLAGADLYAALEAGGSTLARIFLRGMRPFRMQVVDLDRRPVLELRRPFRWYFHQLRVADAHHKPLGSIQRHFSIARRIYSVHDSAGREVYRLFGPLLHPWTFEIRQGDRTVGRIVKKWSGRRPPDRLRALRAFGGLSRTWNAASGHDCPACCALRTAGTCGGGPLRRTAGGCWPAHGLRPHHSLPRRSRSQGTTSGAPSSWSAHSGAGLRK
jgi:hypothetical protein